MKIQKVKNKVFKPKCNSIIKASIVDIFNKGNLFLAIKCMKEYLEKYPTDLNAWANYGKFLRLAKNNEDAFLIFTDLILQTNRPNELGFILTELIYLEIEEHDFSKAYEYFCLFQNLDFKTENVSFDSSLVRLLLLNKLGIYTPCLKRKDYNYFERQLISFEEDDLLKYTFTYNLYGKSAFQNTNCIFNDYINIFDLYEAIKRILPNSTTTPNHNLFDTYLFYYPNIGHDKNGILNYIKVLVIPSNSSYDTVEFIPYRLKNNRYFINDFRKLILDTELSRNLTPQKIVAKK